MNMRQRKRRLYAMRARRRAPYHRIRYSDFVTINFGPIIKVPWRPNGLIFSGQLIIPQS